MHPDKFKIGIAVAAVLLAACLGAAGTVIYLVYFKGPFPDESFTYVCTERGILSRPSSVVTRDGGASGLVGGQLLWTFGETVFNRASSDNKTSRTCTGGLASLSVPLNLDETLDLDGTPFQLVPFTPGEIAFNDGPPGHEDRYVIRPGGVAALSNGSGLIVSCLGIYHGFMNQTYKGIILSLIPPNSSSNSTRLPGLLFAESEPQFDTLLVDDGYLYLFAQVNQAFAVSSFKIARAPLNECTSRSAYEFWGGDKWTENVEYAVPTVPGSAGMSISWNPFLGKYVAVYLQAFSKEMYIETSASITGPWSKPTLLYTSVNASSQCRIHPELDPSGRLVDFSFYEDRGFFIGDIHLVTARLEKKG